MRIVQGEWIIFSLIRKKATESVTPYDRLIASMNLYRGKNLDMVANNAFSIKID